MPRSKQPTKNTIPEKIVLRTTHGTFLSVSTDGRLVGAARSQKEAQMSLVEMESGEVCFKTHKNQFISVTESGQVVFASTCDEFARFEVQDVDGMGTVALRTGTGSPLDGV